MNDLISCVLPTYNGQKWLKESIESVINQSYKHWELIIVNDASSDGTLDIANAYAAQDSRIKVISNETNQKLPKSLNIGFAKAKGAYFTWTSDDNIYYKHAFEKMLKKLKDSRGGDLVFADIYYIRKNGKRFMKQAYGKKSFDIIDLLMGCNIGACFLYTSHIASIVGNYDEGQFIVEDYDYWLRIAMHSNGKGIIPLNETLYSFRMHEDSLTSTRHKEQFEKTMALREHYWKLHIAKYPQDKPHYERYKIRAKAELLFKTMQETIAEISSLICKPYAEPDRIYQLLNAILAPKTAYKQYKKHYLATRVSAYLKAISTLGIFYKFKALRYRFKKSKGGQKHNLATYNLATAHISQFYKAKQWIANNTLLYDGHSDKKGIIISTDQPILYPEVSGYYVPTLLKWGEKDLARAYIEYLLSIQNDDGSFNESYGAHKYTFDTGQIAKGLWEYASVDSRCKEALLKACDYIVSKQRDDGSIATDNYDYWGLAFGRRVPEAIHLYCLEPLRNAAKAFNKPQYEECIQKALKFYLQDKQLTEFNTLTHFNAYIIEALIDLGLHKEAQSAMDKIALLQRKNGFIQAYPDSDKFTCSTGLFQYAICWYKLGGMENIKKGDKCFYHALALQNDSGGWYGSYGKKSNYFPQGEISWAVKYFLDALYYKKYAEVNLSQNFFQAHINANDERYVLFKNLVENGGNRVLDVGCGKGRYERNLIAVCPNKSYFGIDFSYGVLAHVPESMQTKHGHLLNIPFEDNSFDVVFVSEALEHCIDLEKAISELVRVTAKGGKILIIDKSSEQIGRLAVADFEQWFDKDGLKELMQSYGLKVELIEAVSPYYNGDTRADDGLFSAWIGEKS